MPATFAYSKSWGVAEKNGLVVAYVLGYMLPECSGIRANEEMSPASQPLAIVILIASVETSLIDFAVTPCLLHVVVLFFTNLRRASA